MAATDVTNQVKRLNGVNVNTNHVRTDAYIIDAAEAAGLLTVETHSLAVVPAGYAVTGLKVVSLETATSSGSATLQFKLKHGTDAAAAIGSANALAALTAGDVLCLNTSGILAYGDSEVVVQATVGTAAFTKLKFLLMVEMVPVLDFLTMG